MIATVHTAAFLVMKFFKMLTRAERAIEQVSLRPVTRRDLQCPSPESQEEEDELEDQLDNMMSLVPGLKLSPFPALKIKEIAQIHQPPSSVRKRQAGVSMISKIPRRLIGPWVQRGKNNEHEKVHHEDNQEEPETKSLDRLPSTAPSSPSKIPRPLKRNQKK